jgi:hypothetical protein
MGLRATQRNMREPCAFLHAVSTCTRRRMRYIKLIRAGARYINLVRASARAIHQTRARAIYPVRCKKLMRAGTCCILLVRALYQVRARQSLIQHALYQIRVRCIKLVRRRTHAVSNSCRRYTKSAVGRRAHAVSNSCATSNS